MVSTLLSGAVAGFLATAPMTVAMELMRHLLPAREQYALPPSTITAELAEEAGVSHRIDQEQHMALTMVNHFGYGAGAGALYGLFARKIKLHSAIAGMAYGVAVWTVSYVGLLPAVGMYRSATEQPGRRNALMIAAHLVWGAVLGTLFERRKGSTSWPPGKLHDR